VSRGAFRARVEGPRPVAAWVMSIVASATLWVTQQLPPWIVAVQCIVFALGFATRNDPPAFRRSPVWLNVFMAGITTVTIRSALSGNPATISLAYFTALAQGLQLLDARPRKSEFVLVTLALFQVILASNLTDSILFPPLVLVFLASVTWTLLVHTIALEAAEAGDPAAATRVIASDLRRMTMLATSICVGLAIVLFVLFPRLKTNMLRGGPGTGFALSGFSDRVSLGDVGRIRKDRSVVLRVESLEGPLPAPRDAYWRGLAFDAFDGRDWSITRPERAAPRIGISGVGRFGIELAPTTDAPLAVQRIIREPVDGGVLFVPGPVQRIEGSFQRIERDRNGGLYLPGRGDDRIRYTIWARARERDPERLRHDRAALPVEPGPGGGRPATRYLALQPLDPRIPALARRIVADAPTDFDRALRLEAHLRRTGRYTDAPPPLGDAARSPIEAFLLGDVEGHCEYFASGMVTLARSVGLPSRLVNGFAGGVANELGGFLEVTQADAHAWVEIHFEKAGWIRFDPTPPDLRLRAAGETSLWARLGQVGSAVELWWFQRVVDYDSVDQIGALRGLWLAWRKGRAETEVDGAAGDATPLVRDTASLPDGSGWIVIGLVAASLAGWGIWRWRRDPVASAVPTAYRRALRTLARRGLHRAPSVSARAFARDVAERLPHEGAIAFEVITRHYLAERFGGRPEADLAAELERLREAAGRSATP
jgi:transglutaminase-like putative cysteine protease